METRVGRALVAGEVEEGGAIVIDVEADQLTIVFHGPEAAPEPEREAAGAAA